MYSQQPRGSRALFTMAAAAFSPTYTSAAPDPEPLPELLSPPAAPINDIVGCESLVHVAPLATLSSSCTGAVLVLTTCALYSMCPTTQGGLMKLLWSSRTPPAKARAGLQQWRHEGMDITRIDLQMIETVSITGGDGLKTTTTMALCCSVLRAAVPHAQHFPPRDASAAGKLAGDSGSTSLTPLFFWLGSEADCQELQAAVRAASRCATGGHHGGTGQQ